MKPTQEQVIAWAREVGLEQTISIAPDNSSRIVFCPPIEPLERLAALAYEAGRKDENEELTAGLEEVVPTGHHSLQLIYVTKTAADKARAAIRARREQ